jgi:uncharacterized protein (TIGR02301 family)
MRAAMLTLLVLMGLACAFAPPARAQTMPGSMFKLAEVLGGVHHFRTLCDAREGQLWRNKMIELLDAVRPGEKDRQALIARFNDAFHKYRNSYSSCNRSAATQGDRLMDEGRRLADELAAKGFGRHKGAAQRRNTLRHTNPCHDDTVNISDVTDVNLRFTNGETFDTSMLQRP